MHVPSSLPSSFVTLFVTIGPTETAVLFAGLTAGIHHMERRSLAVRSVVIAGLMLLLFAMVGNFVLSLLHVSLSAFSRGGRYIVVSAGLDVDLFEPWSLVNQRRRTPRCRKAR
jgi:multiple antibiotic resistance protein